MSTKKIKQHNDVQFLKDVKEVSEVMAYVPTTGSFLTITKSGIKREAETTKIKYYLTRKIYKVGRLVMVVI